MTLTPIDTFKTTLQTQGKAGIPILRARIAANGIGTLYYGALATAGANFMGHFPWFFVFNYLSQKIPAQDGKIKRFARQAFIGFSASVVSDSVSNSLRVLKTYRQVNETKVSYVQAAKNIIAKDGVIGLFGRGLKTRILTNGLQGLLFSVLWRYFQDLYFKNS
jgi:hypothetical protein